MLPGYARYAIAALSPAIGTMTGGANVSVSLLPHPQVRPGTGDPNGVGISADK